MTLFQIDAFAEKPFEGNPAAVVLLDVPAEASWCLNVAAEMNLSETAFVQPPNAQGFRPLRWFTPTIEVDLCGHATLAAAHALGETNQLNADQAVVFETRSGLLRAERQGHGFALSFPLADLRPIQSPQNLEDALGIQPIELWQGGDDWMAVLDAPESLAKVKPDLAQVATWPCRGLCLTASVKTNSVDYAYRFFAPACGIDEDPVTGSCACYLGPYWAKSLDKQTLVAHQRSARGGKMRLAVEAERVHVVGQAVTVFRGTLEA